MPGSESAVSLPNRQNEPLQVTPLRGDLVADFPCNVPYAGIEKSSTLPGLECKLKRAQENECRQYIDIQPHADPPLPRVGECRTELGKPECRVFFWHCSHSKRTPSPSQRRNGNGEGAFTHQRRPSFFIKICATRIITLVETLVIRPSFTLNPPNASFNWAISCLLLSCRSSVFSSPLSMRSLSRRISSFNWLCRSA